MYFKAYNKCAIEVGDSVSNIYQLNKYQEQIFYDICAGIYIALNFWLYITDFSVPYIMVVSRAKQE